MAERIRPVNVGGCGHGATVVRATAESRRARVAPSTSTNRPGGRWTCSASMVFRAFRVARAALAVCWTALFPCRTASLVALVVAFRSWQPAWP